MDKADQYLGGQAGKAADAIKTRKDRLDEAIDGPKKESPNKNTINDSSKERPKQTKKWYERD